jgi:hypothetical protein
MLAKKLTSFFTALYRFKSRIRFTDNIQTPFAFHYLAIRVALFCAAKRIEYLHFNLA